MRRIVLAVVYVLLLSACGQENDLSGGLTGQVRIDGSSTMFPISEAVAEEYRAVQPEVRVTVGISGTGGGFKKLNAGEVEINSASRLITAPEASALTASQGRFLELPIGYDGLSVVVNGRNDWVDYLTLAELNRIWQPGSQIKTWQDLRANWPDEEIHLYGPGPDSGTFDYFTETVNGATQVSRADFSSSEDDNLLVQGIAGDRFALGYFGFVYYFENQERVRLVPVDSGSGPVLPSEETIQSGAYDALTRPVLLYVTELALQRSEVSDFVEFYVENAGRLLKEVGYFPLPSSEYEHTVARLQQRDWGTAMESHASRSPQ